MNPRDTSSAMSAEPRSLSFHFLGRVPFHDCRRLQEDLAEDNLQPQRGTILLAEHQPHLTVGRQGSWGDIRLSSRQLQARSLSVDWVRRSGATILHGPGQLAILPVIPLGWCDWDLAQLESILLRAVQQALSELGYRSEARLGDHGVWGRSGQLAASGLDEWLGHSRFGVYLNVHPDMTDFGFIDSVGKRPGQTGKRTMSCLLAEQQRPVKMSSLRSVLTVTLAALLGMDDYHLMSGHPRLPAEEPEHVG